MSPSGHAAIYFLVTSRYQISYAVISPLSPAGEGPILREGLAAVGEEDVGVATVSTGGFPDWDDGMGVAPAEAPLVLFCRGERGLWAGGEKKLRL